MCDELNILTVWKENYPDSFTGYAGYEDWGTLVALEPNNLSSVGKIVIAEFLYNVLDNSGQKNLPTVRGQAVVQDINNFYHRKVTQADWDSYDDADKAIITAASLWANNKPFEVGDYLVTVAMHVNTKELDSWAVTITPSRLSSGVIFLTSPTSTLRAFILVLPAYVPSEVPATVSAGSDEMLIGYDLSL